MCKVWGVVTTVKILKLIFYSPTSDFRAGVREWLQSGSWSSPADCSQCRGEHSVRSTGLPLVLFKLMSVSTLQHTISAVHKVSVRNLNNGSKTMIPCTFYCSHNIVLWYYVTINRLCNTKVLLTVLTIFGFTKAWLLSLEFWFCILVSVSEILVNLSLVLPSIQVWFHQSYMPHQFFFVGAMGGECWTNCQTKGRCFGISSLHPNCQAVLSV